MKEHDRHKVAGKDVEVWYGNGGNLCDIHHGRIYFYSNNGYFECNQKGDNMTLDCHDSEIEYNEFAKFITFILSILSIPFLLIIFAILFYLHKFVV